MSTHYTPTRDRVRKDELRAVLRKYGLEPDLETLWTTSLRDTDDIPWMSAEDMRDPRLTGTFEQYVAMQAGEFAVEEPEVENWYRYGE
jgi:hypothetical protein